MKLLEKLRKIERSIAAEKGPFTLFALFLPERTLELWDLVIAAPWASEDEGKALRYIANRLQNELTSQERMQLSRIVILEDKNPGLNEALDVVRPDQEVTEIADRDLFGLTMKKGYIIAPHEEAA